MAFTGADTTAGRPDDSNGLYVMDVRMGRVRLIFKGPRDRGPNAPSWSPDGRRLAFDVNGEGPWVVGADGHGARRLARLFVEYGAVAWSPDGRTIAFAARNRRDSALYTVHADGAPRLRRLTRRQTAAEVEDEAGVDSPAWSPNGKWIAFGRFLYGPPEVDLVRSDGRDEHRVGNGELPVWSPDSRRIVFVADAARADENGGGVPVGIAVAMPGGHRRIVANAPGLEWKATWSADGSRIVFVVGRSTMYIARPGGGMRRLVPAERKRLRVVGTPDQLWARDGTLLVGEGDFDRNTYVLRMVTPRGIRATFRWSFDDAPAWAPDGRRLALVRHTATAQIYVLDVRARKARRLVRGDNPVWSPNGKWIAFERRAAVFVIPASGGRARLVHGGGAPAWSPKGGLLALGGGGGLFVAQVGEWTPRRIDSPVKPDASCGTGPATDVPSAAWSRDGTLLAFTYEAEWCDDGDHHFLAVVTKEGADQQHVGIGSKPQWSPRNSSLFFLDYFGSLHVMRPDGSQIRKLIDGPIDFFSVSPDGRLVAYENGATEEVWVADLNEELPRRLLRRAQDAHPVWRP